MRDKAAVRKSLKATTDAIPKLISAASALEKAVQHNRKVYLKYRDPDLLNDAEVRDAETEMQNDFEDHERRVHEYESQLKVIEESNANLIANFNKDMCEYMLKHANWVSTSVFLRWLDQKPVSPTYPRLREKPPCPARPMIRPPVRLLITPNAAGEQAIGDTEWAKVCQQFESLQPFISSGSVAFACEEMLKELRSLVSRCKQARASLNWELKLGEEVKDRADFEAMKARNAGRTRKRAETVREQIRYQQATFDGCPYCGGALVRPNADHIYPVVRGGLSTHENMVFVCGVCNSRKSDLTLREFIEKQGLSRDSVESNLEKLGKRF